jgi:hypothetical protein
MHGLGQVFVLRPATTEGGRWFEEKIDVARDWRLAFRGGPVPPVLEINVGTDVDDTGARLDARIDQIRLAAC